MSEERTSRKEQDTVTTSIHTQCRESFSHASGLPSTMAVGGDGWRGKQKREGVDLSCQTLAPRGGAPLLPPRLPARTPKVSNRDSGFQGSFSLFLSLSLPSSLLRLCALVWCLSIFRPVLPPVRGSGTHFTFAHFPRGGWLSKLSFETCTFVALTLSRTSGALYFNHILRENGTDTWNSFSRMDFCTAATCGHAYLFVGKTILSGASVASVSRSLAPALPNSLQPISRECEKLFYVARESYVKRSSYVHVFDKLNYNDDVDDASTLDMCSRNSSRQHEWLPKFAARR